MDARLKRTMRLYEQRAAQGRLVLFGPGEEVTIDGYHVKLLDLLVDFHHALAQDRLQLDLEEIARWAKQIYLYERGLESAPLPDLPPDFGSPRSAEGGG